VGRRRAVFLPEVATEQGWDRETLLEGLCRKGGLPPASWKREDARLETFRTLRIFRDPVDPEVIRIEGGES
jgi:AMMECR1 domain-containing protein